MSLSSQWELFCQTTPKAFNFSKADFGMFKKISFQDSIYTFYPYLEMHFVDGIGAVLDDIGFSEGLEWKCWLGSIIDGYVGHDYIWAQHQFNNIKMSNNFAGTDVFMLLSKYYAKNHKQNRAFQMPITSVINQILKTDYQLLNPLQVFVSVTGGVDWWYQHDTNGMFIQDLAETAWAPSAPRSPFFTFFNSNGDFYFMTLFDLFKTQLPVNFKQPYYLKLDSEGLTNPFIIKDYSIQHAGTEYNFHKYMVSFFQTSPVGVPVAIPHTIAEFPYREPGDRVMIKTIDLKPSDYVQFGPYEPTTDLSSFEGRINAHYRDSCISHKMEIFVQFNPKLVAGKIIELSIGSYNIKKLNMLKEYSGNWLISKSLHYVDLDAMPMTRLEIVKSAMYVSPTNNFAALYL